jgi:uncharacterized membrane protein
MIRVIASLLYGLAFIWIGILHFIEPDIFTPLVPTLIGMPKIWVYVSGVFEITLGIGVCVPRFQKISALIIIPMLFVLYTANLNMWINDIPFRGHTMTPTEHVVRAVIQLLLVIVAAWLSGVFSKKTSVRS